MSAAILRAEAEAAGYDCGEWALGGVGQGEVARGTCANIGTWIVYSDDEAMLDGLQRHRKFWEATGDGAKTYVAVRHFLLVAGDGARNIANVEGIAADVYDTSAETFRHSG